MSGGAPGAAGLTHAGGTQVQGAEGQDSTGQQGGFTSAPNAAPPAAETMGPVAANAPEVSSSKSKKKLNDATGSVHPNGDSAHAASPTSPVVIDTSLPPWSRKNTSLDLGDYFAGPRDMAKHSKWPIFLRMHGSILPKLIVPLLFVAGWASCITVVHMIVDGVDLSVQSILLTVTGFVVGLGLSFRSSTAYERYAEGRKFWTALVLNTNNLGRGIWVHTKERHDAEHGGDEETGKKDVLGKLTALNLLVAFAVSLKHKLRWEPYTDYEDLAGLVGHLDLFAREATSAATADGSAGRRHHPRPGFFKATGQYLGISFAASNPRKALKKATKPLGNLPLEILMYLAAYTDELCENDQLVVPMQQTLVYSSIAGLNDVLAGCERVATTPLPIAYSIAITQITWVYVLLLPFQLLSALAWITIPAAIAASYIILGILHIGYEIEDPFGQDVNDLPLDEYCAQVATELDVIASRPKPVLARFVTHPANKPLYPLSSSGYQVWLARSEDKIRAAVKLKTELGFDGSSSAKVKSNETLIGDDRV